MAKAAFCPHCGYGGKGATFIEQDLVAVNVEFAAFVSDSGEVEHDWAVGEAKILWDTIVPSCEITDRERRYRCPVCGREFDNFVIRDAATGVRGMEPWGDSDAGYTPGDPR